MVVKLIAKDRNEKFHYAGRCKLVLDSVSKLLLVEPYIEEFKMISAMFKWEFVAQKNILFVFAEFDFQDFALIFDDSNKCTTIYGILLENGATPSKAELIHQRFLPPLFSEISKNNGAIMKICRILANWINLHNGEEKERLNQILKENNVYDMIFENTENLEINYKKDQATDQPAVRRSLRKRCRNNYYCQDIREHFMNENINYSNQTDDNRRLPFKKSRYSNKIVQSPNFVIFDYERKGKKRSKLIVFVSTDKTLCYEYFWSNFLQMFECCKCRSKRITQSWAKLLKCENGTKCVELLSKHCCKPVKYNPEKYKVINNHIIVSPNFEIIDYQVSGINKSRLFIFPLDDRSLCYEYYWDNGCKLYECCGCELKNKRVSADVLEKNGKKYIELRITQHICELRKYQPEKYQVDASKDIVENANFILFIYTQRKATRKTLVIFPEFDNRKVCYEYYWGKTESRFICGVCSGKKYVYAQIYKNCDGEDYVKLSKNQHVCQPRLYKKENYKSDVILRKPDYEFIEETANGITKKNLLIFDSTNKDLTYHFSYQPSQNEYQCKKCYNKKLKIYANLFVDKEGNEYIAVKNCEHICKPYKYQPTSLKIINLPNYKIVEHMVRRKRIKKLIIFSDIDKKMCFEYTWLEKSGYYLCHSCRTHKPYAKVIKNGEDDEYVELSKNDHSCKPFKFVASKYIAIKCFV